MFIDHKQNSTSIRISHQQTDNVVYFEQYFFLKCLLRASFQFDVEGIGYVEDLLGDVAVVLGVGYFEEFEEDVVARLHVLV